MTTSTGTPAAGLSVRGMVKRYSGVAVLHGVSVDVAPGDIVGLVGHNGAGKSTLLRTISGATGADDGQITVDGAPASIGSPADAIAAGIATVYQELSLLPNLTVTQNVYLGDERSRAGLLRRDAMREGARQLVESFGLDLDVDRRLGDYPVATRQMLEIAVATHREAKYLLLDEPTTSLEGTQVERLLDMVRSLAASGLGIVFVDHKLDELYAVCHRIVALVDGRVRIDAYLEDVSRQDVVAAIAGEEGVELEESVGSVESPSSMGSPAGAGSPAGDGDAGSCSPSLAGARSVVDALRSAPPTPADSTAQPTGGPDHGPERARDAAADTPAQSGTSPSSPNSAQREAAARGRDVDVRTWFPKGATGPRLEVRDLHAPGVHGVSLVAEPGRVLGIYGLVGAGRTEVLRALVGLDPVTGGSVTLDGQPYRPTTPARAQRAGVVYVTEERKNDGIVPGLDSPTNVVLPVLRRYRRLGLLDKRRMVRDADSVLDQLRVRGDVHGPVVALSGGNQQKVLLARAIAQRPRVLLLDEPTKGVDLGVKAEIHRIIRSLAHDAGLTVLLVSSEEDEICEVADDIVVISGGRGTGEPLPAGERTPRALRQAAWAAA